MRLVAVLTLLFGLLLAACAAPRPVGQAGICQDSRILEQVKLRNARYAPDKSDCKSFPMPYREGATIVDVQVARLRSGYFSSSDVMMDRWESFVRLPDGELVSLGWFPALEFNYPAARAYAHKAAGLGEECPINRCKPLLFTPVLEKQAQRLCITYEMKLPYTGSFVECSGDEVVPGEIGVADGAVLWPAPKERVCAQVRSDAGLDCFHDLARPLTAELRSDANEALFYAITVDFGRAAPAGKCRKYVYRFEPMIGSVALMETSGCT